MRYLYLVLGVAIAVLFWTGCGSKKSGAEVASDQSQLFETANPATKANWEKAVGAVNSNDYAGAILILQSMRTQPNMTPEQVKAVDETMNTVHTQMYEAANRGDANAKQAIEQLRKMHSR